MGTNFKEHTVKIRPVWFFISVLALWENLFQSNENVNFLNIKRKHLVKTLLMRKSFLRKIFSPSLS